MAGAFDYSSRSAGDDPKYWVSGTTYKANKVVASPSDFQYYMRKTTGAGTTDPSSDTTNWHPTGGSAIKSIQRGILTIGSSVQTGTATITAVNTSKSTLSFLGFYTAGVDTTTAPTIALTNGTTITGTKYYTSGGLATTNVSWEVIERH